MLNLKATKSSLEEQLAFALQGADYYNRAAAALREAIAKLDSLDGATVRRPTKKEQAAGQRKVGKKVAANSSTVDGQLIQKAAAAKLPSTSSDFWISLLTDQPQSMNEVVNAAIAKLGIRPNADQRRKLGQRAKFAMPSLVKTARIHDQGTGRSRRFMK